MTPQERFNQVSILDEDQESKGVVDANGREIAHSVIVIRNGDDAVLAKYRAKEHITDRDKSGKLIEKEISGRAAAKMACDTNGWKIARS